MHALLAAEALLPRGTPRRDQPVSMTTDESYMRLAIEEAVKAQQNGELPIGAVVVSPAGVIARNGCREAHDQTVLAHAELLALDDACRARGSNQLRDCTIYSTNEPCVMCSAAIFQAKIGKVVYGVSRRDLPQAFRQRTLSITDLAADSGYAPVIVPGVLRDEILQLFRGVARI